MDVRKQKLDEGSDIQQQSISSNINKVEHDAEEAGVLDDTNEVSEDLKVANGEDDDHFFRESSSDVEEEEYKEETDESEF
jgi:hypothetical protein